jgi:hypothetical protein
VRIALEHQRDVLLERAERSGWELISLGDRLQNARAGALQAWENELSGAEITSGRLELDVVLG